MSKKSSNRVAKVIVVAIRAAAAITVCSLWNQEEPISVCEIILQVDWIYSVECTSPPAYIFLMTDLTLFKVKAYKYSE